GKTNTELSQTDKVSVLMDSTMRGWEVANTLDLIDLIAIATQRLNDVIIFATVINWTPVSIPYWYGHSYYRTLFVPIPRALYPEKPNELPGNEFAHRYGMIPTEDYTTSINLAQIIELYINFGPTAVIVGSVVIGMIYRTVTDLFLHKGCGLGAIVAGAYL